MKKNILFIINPISGGKKKLNFPELAKLHLDPFKFNAEFAFTEWPTHANELAQIAAEKGTDIIVSVGGDGTMNEVASGIGGTKSIMGIVPFGSGNGLARTLTISLNNKEAIQTINKLNVTKIDSALLNEKSFFSMAGMGFDAHISSKFAKLKNRGLKGYVSMALNEIYSYVPEYYEILIDNVSYDKEAFMISIANSSQYGNNAYISPLAKLDDGYLDICIIKPFPLVQFPVLGFHLFNKSVHTTEYVEIIKGKEIIIKRKNAGIVHIDGEPLEMEKEIIISVNPQSLSVLN